MTKTRILLLAFALVTLAAVFYTDSGAEVAQVNGSSVIPVFKSPFVLSSHQPDGRISNLYGGPGSDRSTHVATDGRGNWVSVWHSSLTLGNAIGRDWDILVSRSQDNGKTWSPQMPLNTNAGMDRGRDLSPTIATDGNGTWIVAWTSTETFGRLFGFDRDVLFAISTDNGRTWTNPRALNANAEKDLGDDWGVRLTTDRSGDWVAVWASTETLGSRVGGDADIFVARSRDNGRTWTHPVPVAIEAMGDQAFDTAPDIVTDRSGRWLVSWSSGDVRSRSGLVSRRILSAASKDGGASWSQPTPLSEVGPEDEIRSEWSPRLATDRRGNWVAVWSSALSFDGGLGFDMDILVARSKDNGVSWSNPEPLNSNAARDSREDSSPELITDGQGHWVAIWHSWGGYEYTDGGDADIAISHSRDGGQSWSNPALINRASAEDNVDDLLPAIATDRTGNMVVVWQSIYPIDDMRRVAEWRVIAASGSFEQPSGPRTIGAR